MFKNVNMFKNVKMSKCSKMQKDKSKKVFKKSPAPAISTKKQNSIKWVKHKTEMYKNS